jgi:hypothetical protein
MIVAVLVLPGPFGALAPVLNQYGYPAVGVLIMLEDFGLPAPGETVLIAAAVYAWAGQLNAVAVAVIGFFAALIRGQHRVRHRAFRGSPVGGEVRPVCVFTTRAT